MSLERAVIVVIAFSLGRVVGKKINAPANTAVISIHSDMPSNKYFLTLNTAF